MRLQISVVVCALLVTAIVCEKHCGGIGNWQSSSRHHSTRYQRRQPAKIVPRIIGGVPTQQLSWPWMAYIVHRSIDGQQIPCGATVISRQWLLTAAHCISKFHRGSALIGSKNMQEWYLHKYYGIQKVIHHPEYDESDLSNDIALIKLNEKLVFSDAVQPICLSSDDTFFSQTKHKGYVTGWGYYSTPRRSFEFPEDDNGYLKLDEPLPHNVYTSLSDQLLQAEISFIDEDTCRLTWPYEIGENQLCAGAFHRGTSRGDSGGPLQVRRSDGLWYLVGITSFGDESSNAAVLNQHKHPGVYTRVSRYCAFIAKSTKGEVACDDGGTDKQDVEIEYSHEVDYPPDKHPSRGKGSIREEDPIPNDKSVTMFAQSSSCSAFLNVFNMMTMVLISVYGHLLLRN